MKSVNPDIISIQEKKKINSPKNKVFSLFKIQSMLFLVWTLSRRRDRGLLRVFISTEKMSFPKLNRKQEILLKM